MSCQQVSLLEKITNDNWVSISGSTRILKIDNEFYLRATPFLCRYRLESIGHNELKVMGSTVTEKDDSGEYIYYDLGRARVINYSDSTLTISNLKNCVSNKVVDIDFINLGYFSTEVTWDSIELINYREYDTQIKTIRADEDLSIVDYKLITEELALLFNCDITFYSRLHGRGTFHTIKVFNGGEQIFCVDTSIRLHGKIPMIRLNQSIYE